MGLLDGAKKAFLNALREENPEIPQADMDLLLAQLEDKLANEPAPRIALIGETGVGKSSTLNALFNAGQAVSHTVACTQEAAEIRVPLGSIFVDRLHVDSVEVTSGDLVVYDMPGLNESLQSQSHHLGVYEDVLSRVDVALWILDGSNRAMGAIQDEIRKLDPRLTERMVFALNKVDAIFPGETAWIDVANLPSEEQEANIDERLADVEAKVRETLPDWAGAVIGYSAARRYKLPQLFAAMLDGVSRERRWVLTERKDLADFLALVDPRLLPDDVAQRRAEEAASRAARPVVHETPAERRHRLLTSLSPEEFQRVAASPEALADWLANIDVPDTGSKTSSEATHGRWDHHV
jgi:predicted GTPase